MSAFRAFVFAYLKTVDLVYVELAKGHVSDGEDCWLDHYGLPVHMSDSVDKIVYQMDLAMDMLHDDYPELLSRLEIRRVGHREASLIARAY
jgi:hypothetical protein